MLFEGEICWGMGVTIHILEDSSTPTLMKASLVKISLSQSKGKKKTKDMIVGGACGRTKGWVNRKGDKRGWVGECGQNALYTFMRLSKHKLV